MSSSDNLQVHVVGVQQSFVRLTLKGAEATAKTLDELQDLIKSKFPNTRVLLNKDGDNLEQRDVAYHNHGLEQMQENAPQEYPSSYRLDAPPPVEQVPFGSDTEMTNPPRDELFYPPLPARDMAPSPEELVSTLTAKIDDLTMENKSLKQTLEIAMEEKNEHVSKLSVAMQERDDFARQRQTNLQKIRKLNEMIINNRPDADEPLDGEVQQDMYKVRNMAADIIRRYYPGEATFKSSVAKGLAKRFTDPYYPHFYKERLYPYKDPERRRRLLISLLFRELQLLFFGPSAKRFGLPVDMEAALQELEKKLESSTKVTAEENLDWRVRTVSYIGRLDSSLRETIEYCAKVLFYILEPMDLLEDRNGKPDQRELASLQNALQDLCSSSMKLALRFRSSKTKYEFRIYPENTSLANCDEEMIKMVAPEGPTSKPLDPSKLLIFCNLFGALVKTRPSTAGQAGESIVLEAGQIIVWEPQLRGPP